MSLSRTNIGWFWSIELEQELKLVVWEVGSTELEQKLILVVWVFGCLACLKY